MTTIPYANPGVASFELTDDYVNEHLLRGSDPKLEPAISYEAGDDLARFQAVGWSNNDPTTGIVVPATWDADPDAAIRPVGITTAAAAEDERVLVWFAGHFNEDLIIFDASFDTPTKRHAAFIGAPTPTRIRLDPRFG